MLHPTLWLDTPLDVLLNIAKWLSTKRILAFSRTCRYFASTILDTDWTPKSTDSKPKTKSSLWKLARECQYPDKPAWAFLSDCEQYIVASRKMFVIILYKRDFEPYFVEYDEKLRYACMEFDNWGEFDGHPVLLEIESSDILNEYLLVHTDCDNYNYSIVGSYSSKKVAESHIPQRVYEFSTYSIVFNLNKFGLYINNCEASRMYEICSYKYKNGIECKYL